MKHSVLQAHAAQEKTFRGGHPARSESTGGAAGYCGLAAAMRIWIGHFPQGVGLRRLYSANLRSRVGG
jgi:hypothetical protein